MRKYGKYEKRPERFSAKQPQVKSMLLQAYFASLLGLVLCVTMFFGTSYAWFTSEVNNTANEIYVGTLKVGLYKGETDLADGQSMLFDGNIHWEPGHTELVTIKVKNEGDLTFKYVLNFTDGALAETNKIALESVARHFEVWVYDHSSGVYSKPLSYKEITAEGNRWTNMGSLDQLLKEGSAVLTGDMGLGCTHTYTIALHMKESVTGDSIVTDDSIMGQTVTFNVKLVAYQKGYEPEASG